MTRRKLCPEGNGRESCSFIGANGYEPGARVTCYRCGRTVRVGQPVDIGGAHVSADVRGVGLRSVR